MDQSNCAIPAPNPELICGGCGFDLRYSTGRCPDCGRPFNPSHTVAALIPWEQRKHLGWFGFVRGYWATFVLFTFMPWRAGRFLQHPVSVRDARLFRRITVVLAFLPIVATMVLARAYFHEMRLDSMGLSSEWMLLLSNRRSLGICALGLVFGLDFCSKATAFTFVPRSLREPGSQRAAAIAQYSSAPLLCGYITLALLLISQFEIKNLPSTPSDLVDNDAATHMAINLVWSLSAIAIVWLVDTIVLIRLASRPSFLRMLCTAVLLPIVWGACLIATPVVVLMLAAMIQLMRMA